MGEAWALEPVWGHRPFSASNRCPKQVQRLRGQIPASLHILCPRRGLTLPHPCLGPAAWHLGLWGPSDAWGTGWIPVCPGRTAINTPEGPCRVDLGKAAFPGPPPQHGSTTHGPAWMGQALSSPAAGQVPFHLLDWLLRGRLATVEQSACLCLQAQTGLGRPCRGTFRGMGCGGVGALLGPWSSPDSLPPWSPPLLLGLETREEAVFPSTSKAGETEA